MSRASRSLAALGLAILLLPGVASATPQVRLRVEPVPIPNPNGHGTVPGTGFKYGAGAALQAEYAITGNEYAKGAPPPLIGVSFDLPHGSKLHPAGFTTCPTETLKRLGPTSCPKRSAAGPVGEALGYVEFEGEKVEERAEIFSFFAPGGGLEFFTEGHKPVSVEILSTGRYINLNGGGGFGPELISQVPLVPSVPGAADVSVTRIKVKVGAAYESHGKWISYGTVPARGQCPKAGFLIRSQLTFAHNGEESQPEVVTVEYRAPCPRR
ncbi:MAG TPA: hypothetical protein VKG62_01980 [Solirubrobacteraceae bacterium]|nr:hypothetical protein [Solirubrobacteraceae bacterium]